MDQVRVNLPKSDKRPASVSLDHAQFREKERAVPLDRVAGVALRESEVEGISAITTRDSAGARAKGMDKPGNFGKLRGA